MPPAIYLLRACETHLATNPLPDASFKLARARHDVAGVMGDDEGAARELAVMPQYVGPTKLVNQLTYFRSRGSLALKRGDAADALADLQSALALAEEIEAPAPFMLSIGLQLALTHLGQRQFADARAVLAKTRERTQQASWHYVDALHGVSTSLHLWNEDRPLALQSLREGLAIYRQRGRIMFLDAVPPVASLVAARALAADIERHFVEEAIRRRGLPPPNATVEDWPWAVRLRLFGGFAIERPGNETPATARRGKSQLRPIAILRALALLGPRGGDRRALARRVWRGEDPDDQADALDMAIGRARKLIGDDTLVRIQDGRFFLDASRVYVDAWALNDIERIATDARHQQVPLLALQDLGEQLIDIYQGRLLDDDDSMAASAVLQRMFFMAVCSRFEASVARRVMFGSKSGRRVTARQGLALAVSYAGVLLVFGHEARFTGPASWLGAALVFGSALSYAVYLTASAQVVQRLGSLRLTGWATSVACLLCIGQFVLLRPLSTAVVPEPVFWLSLVNGIACTFCPVLMVMMAVERVGATLAAQAGMVGPLSTLALGALLLGEPLNAWIGAGTALVLAGVWLLARWR